MYFDLASGASDPGLEQEQELRTLLREFLGARWSEAKVREAIATEAGFDADIWRQVSEDMALPALAIPERYGGAGFSLREVGAMAEETGRVLLCAPLMSSVVLGASMLSSPAPRTPKCATCRGSPPARRSPRWPCRTATAGHSTPMTCGRDPTPAGPSCSRVSGAMSSTARSPT